MEDTSGKVPNRIWRQSGRTSSKGTPVQHNKRWSCRAQIKKRNWSKRPTCLGGSKVNCKEQRKMTSWLHKRSQCLSINSNTSGLEARFLKEGYLYRMPTDESDNWL